MRQSERLVRRLEGMVGPLSVSAYLLGTPLPPPFLSVDCATPAGEHLANVRWDRKSGTLIALSRPLRLSRSEPGKALSEKEASSRALRWLRLLGVLGEQERSVSVVCRRNGEH